MPTYHLSNGIEARNYATETMTAKERWLATLQRQPTDRVPMDYWATSYRGVLCTPLHFARRRKMADLQAIDEAGLKSKVRTMVGGAPITQAFADKVGANGFAAGWIEYRQRGVFIDFDLTANLPCKEQARQICEKRGWAYEEIPGDLSLLQAWLDGSWDAEDFLVAQSGQTIEPSFADDIIQIEGISTSRS